MTDADETLELSQEQNDFPGGDTRQSEPDANGEILDTKIIAQKIVSGVAHDAIDFLTTASVGDDDAQDVSAILTEIVDGVFADTTGFTGTSEAESIIVDGFKWSPPSPIPHLSEEQSEDSYCGCMFKSTDSSSKSDDGPTASEVLYDNLVNHELYHDNDKTSIYEASVGSSSEDITWDKVGSRIEPFILERNFGYNLTVPPICLSSKFRKEIFYVCSHKGVIYNYEYEKMRFMHGHINEIKSASVESTGKYLVTADVGDDSVIMVTDTTTCQTIYTIYNELGDFGAVLVGMSPNGKYLITIHPAQNPSIKFWLWTYGSEKPNDIYMYPGKKTYGNPKRISFHPNEQEYIMIAFEKQVLFMKWDKVKKTLSTPVIPKLSKKKTGLITDCALVLNSHECFTSTTEGYIQVFANAIYSEGFDEHPVDCTKSFIKSIKVSAHPLLYLQSIDGILVTIDDVGYTQFYNTYVKLLYWIPRCQDISVIRTISFSVQPRQYIFDDPFSLQNDFFSISNPLDYLEMQPEDRVPEYEVLYKNTVPSIASLGQHPFIIRSHVAACTDGCLYLMDLVTQENQKIMEIADSVVASIDCSDERTYLIIAYVNGRLTLYNFETLEMIVTSTKLQENRAEPVECSYVKFSPQMLFFSVAMANGEIWFLNMILEPTRPKPYHVTNRRIMKMCYSNDSSFCAFYDDANVVYLIHYDDSRWNFIGKMRSHFKPIRDMTFVRSVPPKLFTIGEDRYLNEYNVDASDTELIIKSRDRIEQSALPCCFVYCMGPDEKDNIIVANSQQKYKLIQASNRMCRTVALGPSHGCYSDLPLGKLKFLPHSNDKYLIFMNQCHIGIQKLPVDGNPYKYIGVIGNPNMNDFAMSPDGLYLFTCGHNDYTVFMWRTNKGAVDILHRLGGTELDPYYCLIEGGLNGWYFKEMRDLFVYMQILHQGDFYQPQTFGEFLDISELPDLLRSCGFYPSDVEIEDIMNDIKYRNYEQTGIVRDEIKFSEFVKLYINHKPAHGISTEDLKTQFKSLIASSNCDSKSSIDRELFLDILCEYGEPFTESSADKCFSTLLKTHKPTTRLSAQSEHFNYLPNIIDYDKLTKTILGVLNESVYETLQERDIEKIDQERMSTMM